MMITERQIDDIIDHLERQDDKEIIEEISQSQPALLSYVLSEGFEMLTKDENKIMIFLFLVIYSAFGSELEPIEPSDIESTEDKNWEIFNETSGTEFQDKITPFFKDYTQEDLLAFVEDALVDDEDSFVTKEGKELLFIGLKTTIDTLCEIAV